MKKKNGKSGIIKDIRPIPNSLQEGSVGIGSNEVLNSLAYLSKQKDVTKDMGASDPEAMTATLSFSSRSGKGSFEIGFDAKDQKYVLSKKFNQEALHLLTVLSNKITAQNKFRGNQKGNELIRTISFTIASYNELLGLANNKKNRAKTLERLNRTIRVLRTTSIVNYKNKLEKTAKWAQIKRANINIIEKDSLASLEDLKCKNGKKKSMRGKDIITITITSSFAFMLVNCTYIIKLPSGSFEVKNFCLLFYLINQERMNKGRACKVKYLIDNVLGITLKTKRFTECIKNPFIREMSNLNKVLKCEYISSENNKINPEDLKDRRTFLSLKVKLNWITTDIKEEFCNASKLLSAKF
jgi:hypothetical protein